MRVDSAASRRRLRQLLARLAGGVAFVGLTAAGSAAPVSAQALSSASLASRDTIAANPASAEPSARVRPSVTLGLPLPDQRLGVSMAHADHDVATVTRPAVSRDVVGDDRRVWWAPLLSAVVPGLGQGMLRQQRGVVYVAAEGYLVLRALGAQRDAREQREAYREIARTVARAGFGGDRPVGEWAYYERLQYVLESGAFNRTPGAGFTPESDPSTFNGSIWLLARETFWRDPNQAPDPSSPEFQRALAFYQQRAAGEAFLWSWRDAQLEQDLYRQTIDRSNESSRLARQMVGLLLANHALSLVDSYVSVRLRLYGDGPAGTVGVGGSLPLPAARRGPSASRGRLAR